MITGKQRTDGTDYYFVKDGLLITNKWIRSGSYYKHTGASGALTVNTWYKENGKCHFDRDDDMVTGSRTINGHRYQFRSDGYLK